MTESPVDPVHGDHGEQPDERPGADAGENPDGTHDQDADPPTPFGEPPEPEVSGQEDPDPLPGGEQG